MKKMLILSMVMAAASAASAALDTISIEQVPGTNAIALSWSTELRANYVLEDKTDLVIGDWETNTAIIALGDNITVTTAVDQAQSFYRVLETIPVYNFSFELGTLEAWTATGAAFSGQPVTTNWPSSGFDGTYLVNTFWDVDP